MNKFTKGSFFLYRTATVWKALKTLYTLPKEKVDAFVASYEIYNHDWVDEQKLIAEMGPNYYQAVKGKLIDWYSVINHLCAIGQVEKMYIPPSMDPSKSIIQNQNLFEERMAKDLVVMDGDLILDIGCGRGRVANHMVSLTGARVVGINIDTTQLEAARIFAEKTKLSQKLDFRQGDLNTIPYPFQDGELDGIYEVQVFSLAKDPARLFKELHRILKPGAKFVCTEWLKLDRYDESNAHHRDLMKRIKPLVGAIGTPSVQDYLRWMEDAGFEVEYHGEPSVEGHQGGMIEKADRFFTRVTKWIQRLVRFKLLPQHFQTLFDRLNQDGEAFTEATILGLVSSSYYFVARKK